MPGHVRKYTDREEIFNVITHAVGVLFALSATFFLPVTEFSIFGAANCLYWCSLLFMFCGSSLYHAIKDSRYRMLFRKFDHSAIYLLITGTYAPLITKIAPDRRGAAVMLALSVLTAAGIIIKFCRDSRLFHRIEIGIYLLMGWMCIAIAKPLLTGMSRDGLLLLLAGGIAYTSGVIFYIIKKEFFHAVWHVFVLAGAILQFMAVLTLR